MCVTKFHQLCTATPRSLWTLSLKSYYCPLHNLWCRLKSLVFAASRPYVLCLVTLTTWSTQLNEDTCNSWTPNIKLQTPKPNSQLNHDTLWPWPLYLDFPSAPVYFLFSLLFLLLHMFRYSCTPHSIVLHFSVPNVPHYDPSFLSHVLSHSKL